MMFSYLNLATDACQILTQTKGIKGVMKAKRMEETIREVFTAENVR